MRSFLSISETSRSKLFCCVLAIFAPKSVVAESLEESPQDPSLESMYLDCAGLHAGSALALENAGIKPREVAAQRMIARIFAMSAQEVSDVPFRGDGSIHEYFLYEMEVRSEYSRAILQPQLEANGTYRSEELDEQADFCHDLLER